jgi:hypothetical protein
VFIATGLGRAVPLVRGRLLRLLAALPDFVVVPRRRAGTLPVLGAGPALTGSLKLADGTGDR